MGKRTLLVALGLASLGLVSGLTLYGLHKEKNMDTKVNVVGAAEAAGVSGNLGHVDTSPGIRMETATFAMG